MYHELLLVIDFALWGCGGLLISLGAFNLRKSEHIAVGLITGLIVSNWLTNIFFYFFDLLHASLIAAFVTFAVGLLLNRGGLKDILGKFTFTWGILVAFGLTTVIFTAINRGLAILDDFQNLPIISLLVTGDFPPHFALDPSIRFGYHYFLLLFAAQLMKLGNFYVWSAFDLARGIMLASTLTLAYIWLKRITRNAIVSFLGTAFIIFASGTRWLLLLVPGRFSKGFIDNVPLLGSGASSGSDLFTALISPWVIKQGGPIPFPFAFANGVVSPLTMTIAGIGSTVPVVILLVLITYRYWRGWKGASVTCIFIASLALLVEADFAMLYIGLGILLMLFWSSSRRIFITDDLKRWIFVAVIAGIFALGQGGTFTELVRSKLAGLISPNPQPTYFGFGFTFHIVPILISSQLGALSFTNPYQLIAALAEFGPIFLSLPLILMWGWKMFKARRWFESILITMAVLSVFSFFISYEGIAGETAVTRLLSPLLLVCRLYYVPLGWFWLRRQKEWIKMIGLTLTITTMISGVVLFGIQMIAIQKPVTTYYLRDLDVKVTKDYWNRLEPNVLIFDPIPYRTPVVFGRFTKSGDSLVEFSAAWYELYNDPDPYILNSAGYTHVYLDGSYWDRLSPDLQAMYSEPCVKIVADYSGFRNVPVDYRTDFRKLMDIRDCHK